MLGCTYGQVFEIRLNSNARKTSCEWTEKNVMNLVNALWEHGPLLVGVDSNSKGWHNYTSGIVTSEMLGCREGPYYVSLKLVMVGYDLVERYFTVRNAWGAHWGEGGYLRLSMDGNTCAILQIMCRWSEVSLIPAVGLTVKSTPIHLMNREISESGVVYKVTTVN